MIYLFTGNQSKALKADQFTGDIFGFFEANDNINLLPAERHYYKIIEL